MDFFPGLFSGHVPYEVCNGEHAHELCLAESQGGQACRYLMKSVMVSMPTNCCLAESQRGQARTPVSTMAKKARFTNS
jgi:hypothetical protein